MKVVVSGKIINLTDNDYLAQGGQGSIYIKNGIVYKIYHDIKNLIPESKITELQDLNKALWYLKRKIESIENKG